MGNFATSITHFAVAPSWTGRGNFFSSSIIYSVRFSVAHVFLALSSCSPAAFAYLTFSFASLLFCICSIFRCSMWWRTPLFFRCWQLSWPVQSSVSNATLDIYRLDVYRQHGWYREDPSTQSCNEIFWYDGRGPSYGLCSATGTAASLIRGSTYHYLFGINEFTGGEVSKKVLGEVKARLEGGRICVPWRSNPCCRAATCTKSVLGWQCVRIIQTYHLEGSTLYSQVISHSCHP